MKQLGQRVNLIPIIAKADTLTPKDMAAFKNRVRECIRAHNIHVYVPPVESDDEDNVKRNTAIVVSRRGRSGEGFLGTDSSSVVGQGFENLFFAPSTHYSSSSSSPKT